ncbi:hypothetical protein RHGRI_007241 [Rhododendron griersonianum]|uniref:Uncharacterized protein n=1 Tax=Rhododendron griersonianum TaxID=479676 RepID=A0AAV6KW70_9ERIC|nr:hypothetical protein RHGRI_007241 [Rhododendron griersonianum]
MPKEEVTESRHFIENFDSWSESSSEFGGSEEFTPREEEVGLVNDVEEVDLVLPQSSEFGRDEEFTARDEREEEVDPLVIEGGVDDGLVEPSELGANAELTAQCSPLESNVKVEPPLIIPGLGLEEGLRFIGTDKDAMDMTTYVKGHEQIEVYVEHVIEQVDESINVALALPLPKVGMDEGAKGNPEVELEDINIEEDNDHGGIGHEKVYYNSDTDDSVHVGYGLSPN